MSTKLTHGGGGNVFDGNHDLNDPKLFKKFNLNYFMYLIYSSCSEERLLRVKRGERLIPIVKNQNIQYSNLINSLKRVPF